ncbi:MAG: hypothetical protein D6820_05295 [Lentisphaerae bacterium]|nr:MAG: hypothetical protein D6820_05295 [Lentisphaerota bacterium]
MSKGMNRIAVFSFPYAVSFIGCLYCLSVLWVINATAAADTAKNIRRKSESSEKKGGTHRHISQQEMMRYLPKYLKVISPFSWEHPQRWVYIRKRTEFTDREIDIICKAAMVIDVSGSTRRFKAKYPNRLYGGGAYMNLEKDYGSKGLKQGHFVEHPEHYLYKPDGKPLTGADCPWYNLRHPGLRKWWLDEAERQLARKDAGNTFFIDALAKARVVAHSNFTDKDGNPVAKGGYMEQGVIPLLSAARDRFADKALIVGNFLRPNAPEGNMKYVLEYSHCAYIELFERPGNGYVENLNKGIEYLQRAVDAGKMLRMSLGPKRPTPAREMSMDEKREKARLAMPEFWKRLNKKEQDELAEIYAYFDFKLAIFLMAAGEHSYLRYTGGRPMAESAGTDLFKLVQPFPEWNMPLGRPLEKGKRYGNVWKRKFENVEVVLDLNKGICRFIGYNPPWMRNRSKLSGSSEEDAKKVKSDLRNRSDADARSKRKNDSKVAFNATARTRKTRRVKGRQRR